MGSTAGLNIHSFNIDNSDYIARYNTTLIQMEPKLFLGFTFILEIFSDAMALKNNLIGLVFNGHFSLLGNWFIVGEI